MRYNKIFLIIALFLFTAEAYSGDLDGIWIGTLQSGRILKQVVAFELTESNQEISGIYSSAAGFTGIIRGKRSKEGRIDFTLRQKFGGTCEGDFSGSAFVRKDTIELNFSGSDCFGQHKAGKAAITKKKSKCKDVFSEDAPIVGNFLFYTSDECFVDRRVE